jgi:hypothetical protein
MRPFIAALGLLLLAPLSALAAPPVSAGAYNDAMLIGYDPATGIVRGYFDMQRGEQPSFSCIFYLHGKLAGSRAAIETFFPPTPKDEVIKGELDLTDASHFQVRLASEHGGCGMVESFADANQPASFDLATARPWVSVAVVKAAKAYFYDSPGGQAHRKAYLVKGDGVGVRAARPGWIEVDYTGGDKMVSGWLRAADVYPLP